jgi:heme-degrading monooxygenase HmoA
MSYFAMNRFKVRHGHEDAFETMWRARESRLNDMPGFVEFRLLKGPDGDGFRLYTSHVQWATREDFEGWTKSQAFRESHRNAGNSTTRDALMGPPAFEGFETVLQQS